jgi:hypothetical protein
MGNNQIANETRIWKNLVQSSGGGFQWNSVAIANAFVKKVKTKSYYSKIIYLNAMLGTGIGAALVPLIDKLGVGAATNSGFLDADFNQALGLQGNGAKILNTNILPSSLGTTNNGGLGHWENNYTGSGNVEPIGCYNNNGSSRFVIDLRPAVRNFRWGTASNGAGDTAAADNAHWYGQRSSATSRELFRNAISININTTNDATSQTNDLYIHLMGSYENIGQYPWPGRCGLAYLTDGTLSGDEISDFNLLLRAYLIGPTGKP